MSIDDGDLEREAEYLAWDEALDAYNDLCSGKLIGLVMLPCAECGALIGCLWRPEGAIPPASCAEHSQHPNAGAGEPSLPA